MSITLTVSEQEKTFINKFAEKAEKIKPIPEWHPLEILLAIAGDAQEMEDDNSRLKEENKRLREALEEITLCGCMDEQALDIAVKALKEE